MQVWRVSFALGAVPLAFMIYYRIFHLRESAVWAKRTDATGSRMTDMNLLFKWYAFPTAFCFNEEHLIPQRHASHLQ